MGITSLEMSGENYGLEIVISVERNLDLENSIVRMVWYVRSATL